VKWLNLDDAVLVNLGQVTSIEVLPSQEDEEGEEEGLLQIALSETASGIDLAVAHFPSFEDAQAEYARIKSWLATDEVVHTVSAPAWVMPSPHDHEDDLDEYDDEYDDYDDEYEEEYDEDFDEEED